jgi:hypothetical protein
LTSFCIDDVHLDEPPISILDDDDDDDELEYFGQAKISLKNMHNTRCVKQILDFFEFERAPHLTHNAVVIGYFFDFSSETISRDETHQVLLERS